jgi:putative ABC transport system permease protein
MLKASWKSLWARKVSLLLSTVAIVLGTAFVGGSFTFTDMLQSAFNGIMSGSVADVNVQAKNSMESMGMSDRTITREVVDKVAAVDGVEHAYGTVGASDAYVLGKNGKPLTMGAPGIGSNYIDAPAAGNQQGLVMKSGNPPRGPDEVVTDPDSLGKLGAKLGDTIKIYTSGKAGVVSKKVVGTALYGSKGSTGGADLRHLRHRRPPSSSSPTARTSTRACGSSRSPGSTRRPSPTGWRRCCRAASRPRRATRSPSSSTT